MSDESINLRSANALLSGHYADITAKDIALGQVYALLSIAESLATLAGQQGQDLREEQLRTQTLSHALREARIEVEEANAAADEAEAERDALAAKVAAVRALHVMHPDDCACDLRDEDGSCFLAGTCDGEASNPEWPCPTIKALEVDR